MTKKFRFMTGLLAVVLAFVMLSSVAYIAAESDHDCTGVDCAICHQINVCENLLKSIGLAGSAAATVTAILYILCRIIPSCTEVARTFTLVSLKVKLSNKKGYKGEVYSFWDRLLRRCRLPLYFCAHF